MGGGEEFLQHGSKTCPKIDGKRDEDHVFEIKFTNDTVAMDEGGGTGGGLVHPSQFTLFVMLKIVVCIGSDCVGENTQIETYHPSLSGRPRFAFQNWKALASKMRSLLITLSTFATATLSRSPTQTGHG